MKKYSLACLTLLLLISNTTYAFVFNRMPAGWIKGARLERVSDTTIKIGVGFGELLGQYWEIASNDPLYTNGYTLTSLTTSAIGQFQYIYIDREASSLPYVALRNSTNAPVWTPDFLGWYDGLDRCIGAVWIKSDGKIADFYCPEDDVYLCGTGTFFSNGALFTVNPNTYTNWNLYDCSSRIPVNAYEANLAVGVQWNGTGTPWAYARAGVIAETPQNPHYEDGSLYPYLTAWVAFKREAVKRVYWLGLAPTTSGSASLSSLGYKLER